MVIRRNKSTLTKNTPAKSTVAKSNAIKSSTTPLKRKHESVGGITKKIRVELSNFECRKAIEDNFPSVVLAMGSGDTGQLGMGEDILERKRPSVIPNLMDIVAIRAGGMHSVCLSKQGKVYTFGCNDEGALGRPIVEDEEATIPGIVELPDDIVVSDITAGDNHSAVLTTDGRVYIWGSFRDNNGLIGMMKPFEKLPKPTVVPTDRRVMKIASGENHFAMLTETGDVLTFGCAEQGQLGRISPNNLVRGGRGGLAALLVPGPVRVRHSVKFCDLWAGAFCTVAKSIDGLVYGCGLNNYRQLGLTAPLAGDVTGKGNDATSSNAEVDMCQLMMTNMADFNRLGESWRIFAFGQHHTIALTASHRAYVIGRGEYGSLGQGDNEHRSVVTRVKLGIQNTDNSDNDDGEQVHIRAVAACNRTSYALMDDGSVLSWGMGSSYQLGHGEDDEDVNVPTKMTGKQICDKRVVEISPGFQHVLLRAMEHTVAINVVDGGDKNNNTTTTDDNKAIIVPDNEMETIAVEKDLVIPTEAVTEVHVLTNELIPEVEDVVAETQEQEKEDEKNEEMRIVETEQTQEATVNNQMETE